MGTQTKIEWCDHTFNPWIGCTRVSPGCDHCYAERMSGRRKWAEWGPGTRRRTSPATWRQPLAWDRAALEAAAHGSILRPRVFCASLADVFDPEVSIEWFVDLLNLINVTPRLQWLLLTKRVVEIAARWRWGQWLPNMALGFTAENQEAWDARASVALEFTHAYGVRMVFASIEPMLGPISLRVPASPGPRVPGLAWLICGGETGPGARPMDPTWVRNLRDQCQAAGVPFFFKGWGDFLPSGQDDAEGHGQQTDENFLRVGKRRAGALLDGREWREFPSP